MTLRENSRLGFFLIPFLFGCISVNHKVLMKPTDNTDYRYEVEVISNRVVPRCEKLFDESDHWYGFMISILDERNTVTTGMSKHRMPKKMCFEILENVQRVLQSDYHVQVGGLASPMMNDSQPKEKKFFDIPFKGRFLENGQVFDFYVIRSKSLCYSTDDGYKKPCPRHGYFDSKN